MDKEHLKELRTWLSSDCIDDAEDLFDEVENIIKLIDFYLENHHE